MAQLSRIEVYLNTSAAGQPVGHLVQEIAPGHTFTHQWRCYCDIPDCAVGPDDFSTFMLTPVAALDQLSDHLTEDHGVTP